MVLGVVDFLRVVCLVKFYNFRLLVENASF